MSEPDENEPSAIAQAMNWASRVMTMGFSIVVPTFIGYLLDNRWQTAPLLALGGALFGMVVAVWQFYKMLKELGERE